jgi:hypothetical protein
MTIRMTLTFAFEPVIAQWGPFQLGWHVRARARSVPPVRSSAASAGMSWSESVKSKIRGSASDHPLCPSQARPTTKLVDRYLGARHRAHPESGCGVAGIAADVARADGSARDAYTHQVQKCLAVLAALNDNADRKVGERDAVLTLSVLVGAISMARAVDDPDLPS